MTIVDLHPEELFDKMVQGRLSTTEGERLHAHLATCAACRFEVDVRRDFAETVRDLAFGLPLAAPNDAPPPRVSEFRSLGARPGRRRSVWLLSLAAALVASASVAALVPGVGTFVGGHLPKAFFAVAPRVASPSATAYWKSTTREVASPAPRKVDEPSPSIPDAPTKLEDLPLAHAPAPAETSAKTAAELFREANQARRAGDDRGAMGLYRALEQRYPNSAEARLSHATLGRLMLDRGDAELALEDFDRYLSEGGTALGEEALVGRALALGKLGARGAEASAWKEVLRRFPKSIHARLARTRLSALGEP